MKKKSNFDAPRDVPWSGQMKPVGRVVTGWAICRECGKKFTFKTKSASATSDDGGGGMPLGQMNRKCVGCFKKMQEKNRTA